MIIEDGLSESSHFGNVSSAVKSMVKPNDLRSHSCLLSGLEHNQGEGSSGESSTPCTGPLPPINIRIIPASEAPYPPRFMTIWPDELIAPFRFPIPSTPATPLFPNRHSCRHFSSQSQPIIVLHDDDVTPPMQERHFEGAALRLYYSGDQIIFFSEGAAVLFEPVTTRNYGYLVTSFCAQKDERFFFRLETYALEGTPIPVLIHNWPTPIILGVDNGCTDMILDLNNSLPDTRKSDDIVAAPNDHDRQGSCSFLTALRWIKSYGISQLLACIIPSRRIEDGRGIEEYDD
ncbi:hypothetical protein CVT26_009226 [Gymnopilus dilepis]|uniref:Uncharacterized protein n=1 Tax=Gymnopilus dilepis TaxID=231916 RepID=A0A409WCE4_9AGAR|nr:hypothetical protein CVT26_009226 [Gymnopilus dilepis]